MRGILLFLLIGVINLQSQPVIEGDTELRINGIPFNLVWDNKPEEVQYGNGILQIVAGEKTDLFRNPRGQAEVNNSPRILFEPEGHFLFSSKVSVEFATTFDAGVLVVYGDKECWAKLCFELSPQKQPTIVTVVNKGVSDDSNHVPVTAEYVYLRVAGLGDGAFAFHYSPDGKTWHLARYFALSSEGGFRVGFSAQSPTGKGCKATFSEIRYQSMMLQDVRSGERTSPSGTVKRTLSLFPSSLWFQP
jgi:regulation of enolase protein 1 (concanavalin A-like superfamily)